MNSTASNDKSFYDRMAGGYDALCDKNEHAAREQGLAALAVRPGERVLEIGYGTGHSLVELATFVGSGGAGTATGHVDGVDVSDGMRTVAAKRIERAGLSDRVTLAVAPVPPLPYAGAMFDVVSMSFTLELFPLETIPTVLAEIRRVLKPSGRLGVVSMSLVQPGDKDSTLEHTYKWMHRHFPHIVDCQPIDVEGSLTRAGFTIASTNRIMIWTMPVTIVVGVGGG